MNATATASAGIAAPVGVQMGLSLARFTTMESGGPAARLVDAASATEVAHALTWARSEGLPVTVLGGGSNVVVSDAGLGGVVLRPRVLGVRAEALGGGRVAVTVGAGEPLDAIVARAVAEEWAGLECLSGVPGWVGATPIQNVGAYGQEVAETIAEVRGIDRASAEPVSLPADACGFGYRTSAWKGPLRDAWVITEVVFHLRRGGAPAVRYAELARALENVAAPTLAETRAAVLALRSAKSMVLADGDPNRRSAGSFFTNPVVEPALADEVARVAADAQMPRWPVEAGLVKLSAGWLIERAGFPRGSRDGRVGLSSRHALALVNHGGATSAELIAFAARVRAAVFGRFGVTLTPEPELLGFTPEERALLLGAPSAP